MILTLLLDIKDPMNMMES